MEQDSAGNMISSNMNGLLLLEICLKQQQQYTNIFHYSVDVSAELNLFGLRHLGCLYNKLELSHFRTSHRRPNQMCVIVI